MGQVWSAVHTVTGRRVAIKRLLLVRHDDDEHADSQARARFILEAQAACAVEHPNVVEVLDFVEPGDEPPLLVMELLQGETLAAKLDREHVLSLAETASLLLPVVSAVGTAHSLGIIHRDLKPANIFLQQRAGQERVVKVLDFGIAKWVAPQPSGSAFRTDTGSTLGTPCYMAPEQAVGERQIDHTADIWSIGIILYECLAGARPVEGENAAQMVMRLLNTGIMPIERVVPTLPDEVARMIGRMLSREAAQRPPDLREIFEVLRQHSSVSAPPFSGPSSAIGQDAAAPLTSTAISSTVVSNSGSSSAVDAHAATLRGESTGSRTASSWTGQRTPTPAPAPVAFWRRPLALLLALPVVAVLIALRSRHSDAPPAAATTPAGSHSSLAPTEPSLSAASTAAPASTVSTVPSSNVPSTQIPSAASAPRDPARAAEMPDRAKTPAKVNPPTKRRQRAESEDEDGTLDRK